MHNNFNQVNFDQDKINQSGLNPVFGKTSMNNDYSVIFDKFDKGKDEPNIKYNSRGITNIVLKWLTINQYNGKFIAQTTSGRHQTFANS